MKAFDDERMPPMTPTSIVATALFAVGFEILFASCFWTFLRPHAESSEARSASAENRRSAQLRQFDLPHLVALLFIV